MGMAVGCQESTRCQQDKLCGSCGLAEGRMIGQGSAEVVVSAMGGGAVVATADIRDFHDRGLKSLTAMAKSILSSTYLIYYRLLAVDNYVLHLISIYRHSCAVVATSEEALWRPVHLRSAPCR